MPARLSVFVFRFFKKESQSWKGKNGLREKTQREMAQKTWYVAAGGRFRPLAESVARGLGAGFLSVEFKTFPDGENKVTISEDAGSKRVIVVQSTSPPVDSSLVQLLFLCHKLSEDGAEVYCCIPYLGYSRQDKEFLPGEVVSLGVVGRLLRSVGVKRLLTIDIHSPQGLALFSFPAYSASAIPLLAKQASKMHLENPIVVSPDVGGATRAHAFAQLLKAETIEMTKERDRKTGEISITYPHFDCSGRDVLLVDDIISTGGTIAKSAFEAKNKGARNVFAFCVHSLMLGDAKQKIENSGVDKVVCTNTVPDSAWTVDVSPVIVSYFKSL
jgi:ribose-phosphate pyrophosphokinase